MSKCSACSRVSGSRFQNSGYDGIGRSLVRGSSAFTGYVAGKAISKQLNTATTAPSKTVKILVGLGKVAISHIVTPLLLPDKYEEHPVTQGICDGFGISGFEDVMKAAVPDFSTTLGISGADFGFPGYLPKRTPTGGNTPTPSADLA